MGNLCSIVPFTFGYNRIVFLARNIKESSYALFTQEPQQICRQKKNFPPASRGREKQAVY